MISDSEKLQKEIDFYQSIEDLEEINKDVRMIIRSFQTDDNWQQIERLIKRLQDYEKYIAQLELDNMELLLKLSKIKTRANIFKNWILSGKVKRLRPVDIILEIIEND